MIRIYQKRQTMTYGEWERRRRQRRLRQLEKLFFKLVQAFKGLAIIAIGLLVPFVCGGDATACFIFVLPILYYLTKRKEKEATYEN